MAKHSVQVFYLLLLLVRYWIWLRTSITAYKSLMVVQTVSTSSCYLAGPWNQTLDLHSQIYTWHLVIPSTRTFPHIENSTRVMVICDLWTLRVYQTVHLGGRIMKQYTSTLVVFWILCLSSLYNHSTIPCTVVDVHCRVFFCSAMLYLYM